jgi:hypothetical protein
MGQIIFGLLVLSSALIAYPASAQPTSYPTNACDNPAAKFDVTPSTAASPSLPETGKALVIFVEKDLTTTWTTPSTLVGVDGRWIGATHGNSNFFFSVDPGIHHVCALTKFGGMDGEEVALMHFTAEAGGIYYLEGRNTRVAGSGLSNDLVDVSLFQIDVDEGNFLSANTTLVTSQRKK